MLNLGVVEALLGTVCQASGSEQAAAIRLGEPVVLHLRADVGFGNVYVYHAEVLVKAVRTFSGLYDFIKACEYLGWQYVLEGPRNSWGVGLYHSSAYKGSNE